MAFVIGIDFDDVLVNGADEMIRLYNRGYNTNLSRANWHSDFGDMTPFNNDEPAEVVRRVIAIEGGKEFSEGLAPIDGAHDVLKKLKHEGHKLLVITGRPEVSRNSTIATLERLFGDIFSLDDLYFTDHYNHSGTRKSKGDIALQLGLTHFIDDLVDHANSVAAKGIKTLLFSDNYAWSQLETAPEVVRVSTWREIGEFFDHESTK